MEKGNSTTANIKPPNSNETGDVRRPSCLLIVQLIDVQVRTLFEEAENLAVEC